MAHPGWTHCVGVLPAAYHHGHAGAGPLAHHDPACAPPPPPPPPIASLFGCLKAHRLMTEAYIREIQAINNTLCHEQTAVEK